MLAVKPLQHRAGLRAHVIAQRVILQQLAIRRERSRPIAGIERRRGEIALMREKFPVEPLPLERAQDLRRLVELPRLLIGRAEVIKHFRVVRMRLRELLRRRERLLR